MQTHIALRIACIVAYILNIRAANVQLRHTSHLLYSLACAHNQVITQPRSLHTMHNVRTRLDPETLLKLTKNCQPDNPQSLRDCDQFAFYSTDPQPGVASVGPKPQCAFEESTFAKSCNSRHVSHFAAFFIDPRAE